VRWEWNDIGVDWLPRTHCSTGFGPPGTQALQFKTVRPASPTLKESFAPR
jgi:hypothetical protein